MTEINFFRNFRKNRNFSKIWLNSKFFENFDQNRNFFENFGKFEQNRIFSKIWLKSKIFENFAQIEFFFENLIEIEICRRYWLKLSKFFENLSKMGIFRNLEKFFFEKLSIFFYKNSSKSEFFSKIWLKSKFVENLSKIGIFRNFWTKSKFLRQFVEYRNFLENLTKI